MGALRFVRRPDGGDRAGIGRTLDPLEPPRFGESGRATPSPIRAAPHHPGRAIETRRPQSISRTHRIGRDQDRRSRSAEYACARRHPRRLLDCRDGRRTGAGLVDYLGPQLLGTWGVALMDGSQREPQWRRELLRHSGQAGRPHGAPAIRSIGRRATGGIRLDQGDAQSQVRRLLEVGRPCHAAAAFGQWLRIPVRLVERFSRVLRRGGSGEVQDVPLSSHRSAQRDQASRDLSLSRLVGFAG